MASDVGPGFAAPAAIERVITTVAEMQQSAECWRSHQHVIPVSTGHAVGERRGKRRGYESSGFRGQLRGEWKAAW